MPAGRVKVGATVRIAFVDCERFSGTQKKFNEVCWRLAGRLRCLANNLLERLHATIRYNLTVDFAPSFVDAKDRLLVGRSALSPRTDVAFESIGSKAGFMGFYHPA